LSEASRSDGSKTAKDFHCDIKRKINCKINIKIRLKCSVGDRDPVEVATQTFFRVATHTRSRSTGRWSPTLLKCFKTLKNDHKIKRTLQDASGGYSPFKPARGMAVKRTETEWPRTKNFIFTVWIFV
jgi:hypothetical protein